MVGEALAEEAGGEAEEEAIAEDGIPARPLAAPPSPTAEMVEFYNVSHIPFRSWCPHCVPGRGRSFYHRRVDHKGDDTLLPGVSIDCGFFVRQGSYHRMLWGVLRCQFLLFEIVSPKLFSPI